MPIIEIEISQAVWNALEKACEAPENREPRINPANPKEVIVGPKWNDPADLAEKALEPILAQVAGPHMPVDEEVNTLLAQQQAIAEQIAARNKAVKTAKKKEKS